MSGSSEVGNMWSRRRAAVQAEAQADVKAEADAVVAQERAALENMSDEDALAELELPNPDQMEAGSDFSAFMKAAVPDRLRRRALRKLWLTNPALANVDNLVDYGEDFTVSTALVENIQTIYRVGKGMLPDALDQSALENDGLNFGKSADLTDSVDDAQPIAQKGESPQTQGNSRVAGEALERDALEFERMDPAEASVVSNAVDVPTERMVRDVEAAEVADEPLIKRRMRFEFVS